MKFQFSFLKSHTNPVRVISQVIAIIFPCLIALHAHAGTSKTDSIPISMNSMASCSVKNATNLIIFPSATSSNQSVGDYVSKNFKISDPGRDFNGFTSDNYNQVTTITCDEPSKVITGFIVRPLGNNPYTAYFNSFDPLSDENLNNDTGLFLEFQQVAVNSTKAAYHYYDDVLDARSYNGSIVTEPKPGGTVKVTWRPVISYDSATKLMGSPAGGLYSTQGIVVVDY